MPTYRAFFERLNFGVSPPLKQTADVIFHTDISDEDATCEAFDAVIWAAMWEQNSHWTNPAGPACLTTGWSSVMLRGKVECIDADALASLAWHTKLQGWLIADGATVTDDPDLAYHYSPTELIALEANKPVGQRSVIQSKLISEIYGKHGDNDSRITLQLIQDTFIRWGYGPEELSIVHVDRASSECAGHTLHFHLPPASDGPAGLPPAQEYERRVSWAWRFVHECGGSWTLAESEE
ncbi:MAG: hypothetical protein Q7U16_02230, partial [Agitococcus sp.]|nr:hypothetical protein [Agitococcus sp.]